MKKEKIFTNWEIFILVIVVLVLFGTVLCNIVLNSKLREIQHDTNDFDSCYHKCINLPKFFSTTQKFCAEECAYKKFLEEYSE
jgi:hypothetical protein